MLQFQFLVHHHVGARRAEVRCCAGILAVAAKQLDFDADRKILILRHRRRGLTVHHHTAVANGPARTALALVTDESVFHPETVVAKLVAEKQVPETFAKFRIPCGFVANLEQSVFNAECVVVVVAEIAVADFGCPAVEIATVEKLYPLVFGIPLVGRLFVFREGHRGDQVDCECGHQQGQAGERETKE